ncbi:hypothetical protein CFP65_3815 [Kitasatospora sp. MMS16-BH015]|nr:hypothetical protein CFP65_3815 [Kitasatospora sp. MMS16-BH015]
MALGVVFLGGILLLLAAVVGAACSYWASGSVLRRAGMGCLCGVAIVLLPLTVIILPLFFIR